MTEPHALDTIMLAKPASEKAEVIDLLDSRNGSLTHFGRGSMVRDREGLHLKAKLRHYDWVAHGCPPDGDYCNFGSCGVEILPFKKDLRQYNRILAEVEVEEDILSPQIIIGLQNEGEVSVPDPSGRTGSYYRALTFGRNRIVWEFPELTLDKVTKITLAMPLNGDCGLGMEYGRMTVRRFTLDRVEQPETFGGWDCGEEIAHSTAGYIADGRKIAVSSGRYAVFRIEDIDTGESRTLPGNTKTFAGGLYTLFDFSCITREGRYRLYAGEKSTQPFPIQKRSTFNRVMAEALLEFIHSERCGCAVEGKHPLCHKDIVARLGERVLSYNGGWHDAGDLSQQTLQTAETAEALVAAADRVETEALRHLLEEEGAWGFDFVEKTYFGEGYHATSAGITRWTDNIIGTMDDATARCHNHAFENYRFASVLFAGLAHTREEARPAVIDRAVEYFRYAESRFRSHGMELPVCFEHSYSSPLSLYHAAAVTACEGVIRYADRETAAEAKASMETHLAALLACQEAVTERVGGGFCRDSSRKVATHFNHQSREQLYAMALCAAKRCLPDADGLETAIQGYAGYLRTLYAYASPYGMFPAGVYRESEAEDTPENREIFGICHLYTDFDTEQSHMLAQIRAGQPLGEGRYLRQFPVWFSFRGNAAVMLSLGAAARLMGELLADQTLLDAADAQLYFLLGLNPLRQSLVYGVGDRYARLYSANLGDTRGALPVGMETDGDNDLPFWPCAVNATYKEVWVSTAARALLLLR